MWYFFDESGNWQEIEKERKRLVVAGVLVRKKYLLDELNFDFDQFRAKYGLKSIHATELNPTQRESLSLLIEKYLKEDDIKAFAYVIEPKRLLQTQRESDDIYIDFASELIANMIFLDKEPIIKYDMKFHYSYSANVLDEIGNENYEFLRMKRNFFLKKHSFERQRERISKLLKRVGNFDEKKLNEITFINDYLWTEFRLNIQKSYLLRETLKDRIRQHIKAISKDFNIDEYEFDLEIDYQKKFDFNAGIEFVDSINNIIYNRLPLSRYVKIKEIV